MRISISDAKRRLSKLVDAASAGREVVIVKNGTPVARLVGVRQRRGLRHFGIAKGRYSQEEIDAAFTPEVEAEIARMFDGDL